MKTQETKTLIGNAIKTLRINKGLTQHALSKETGVHYHTIRDIESGKGASIKFYEKLLSYFNCDISIDYAGNDIRITKIIQF